MNITSRRATEAFVSATKLITVLKCHKHKDLLVVVMLDELERQVVILYEDVKSRSIFENLPSVGEVLRWIIEVGLLIASSNVTISYNNSGNRLNI
jgi:hypothetical protein